MTALADHLEIWGFEGDQIVFGDGSMGLGMELSAVDVATWDDDALERLSEQLKNFLNGLPSGTDLQFIQEIRPCDNEILMQNNLLVRKDAEEVGQALHRGRQEFLASQLNSGVIPRQRLYLFFRRSVLSDTYKNPFSLKKRTEFAVVPEEIMQREHRATEVLFNQIADGLTGLRIAARRLSEREVTEALYRQWNPLRTADLRQYDPEDVRYSVLFSDVGVYDRGFTIAGMHYRVVSLKILPDTTFASMARVFQGLPLNSKLFLSIHVPNQQKELEGLQTQRRLAFSMARGKTTGVSDIESESKLQDLESLIAEMVAQGEKVFQASLTVLVESQDQELLNQLVSHALSQIRELAGAEGMEESLAAFDIFSETAIPNAKGKTRAKRIKTSNLADLLPIYGPWTGFEIPRILLKTRENSLFSFDPFTKDFSNSNQIIAGGSGSGKSFLTNVLLLQTLKEKPRIFIIDIGGSYRKLCENLSGQYIPFNLETELSLNPFDLPTGETAPSSQKIKFLVGLIEMMTREEGEERIGRLERAEVEEAIQHVYRASDRPTLTRLKEALLSHKMPEIQRFGKILASWCGTSPYGKVVDRPTSVSLSSPIVCFDLKGLESQPDLQAVCLYLITDFVWREVQKDRDTMKFLVFDECWKLLENAAGSSFIGEVFRTFRKYFASAVAISQNIDDFAKSSVAQALLPNTSLKWILMQKGADIARLKEVLRLNDAEIGLITSLQQKRGEYSEAFLMAEDKKTVVRIEPTPLEYWIATTDPRDLAAVEQFRQKMPGRSQLEILNELAVMYPKGMLGKRFAMEEKP